ncbi:hypothetical protein [Evansella cellulosilytica]|nr:hypothetical protein [Evansella cellulosilytica]
MNGTIPFTRYFIYPYMNVHNRRVCYPKIVIGVTKISLLVL